MSMYVLIFVYRWLRRELGVNIKRTLYIHKCIYIYTFTFTHPHTEKWNIKVWDMIEIVIDFAIRGFIRRFRPFVVGIIWQMFKHLMNYKCSTRIISIESFPQTLNFSIFFDIILNEIIMIRIIIRIIVMIIKIPINLYNHNQDNCKFR